VGATGVRVFDHEVVRLLVITTLAGLKWIVITPQEGLAPSYIELEEDLQTGC